MHHDVSLAARGKWRGILLSIGLDDRTLSGKQVPCPDCGGRDRFRWDNKEGRGTWYCNGCGAGDGFDLIKRVKGCGFAEAAQMVEGLVGITRAEQARPDVTEEKRKQLLRELWKASQPIRQGDMADQYLRGRGIEHDYPNALRFSPSCFYAQDKTYPAMLGVVSDAEGKPVTLHRTYLQEARKAPVEDARRLMPGSIPEGSAIRLGPANKVLGVAEGIETALAASMLFEIPVWATVSATMMEKWTPPDGTEEVVIFGDADPGFAGQAATFVLAKRMAARRLTVTPKLPPRLGQDWLDVLNGETA